MKMAVAIGEGRHYVVNRIALATFPETAALASLPATVVVDAFREFSESADAAMHAQTTAFQTIFPKGSGRVLSMVCPIASVTCKSSSMASKRLIKPLTSRGIVLVSRSDEEFQIRLPVLARKWAAPDVKFLRDT
jgi:hypothetical protein